MFSINAGQPRARMAAERHRPFRPVVRRDEREHVAVLGAVPLGQIDAADEERGRERIRRRGVRGDDACADDAGCRPAGPRIDDVAVATAVGDDELLAGAARAEGGVAQPEARDGAPGHERRHEVDPPAVAATAEREQAAPAGGKQRVRDAGRRSPAPARSSA